MELILPQVGLFFWTLVVFLTVFFLMRKFAWKPILDGIHERERDIDSKLKAAAAAEEKMKSLTAENEKILAEARSQRDSIMKEANTIREQILAEAKVRAEEDAARTIKNAQLQIQSEKNAAIAEIKNQSVELALAMTEQVLRKKLENKKEDEAFLKTLVSDIKLN